MIYITKLVCVCAVFCTVIPQQSALFAAFEYRGLGWPAALANIKVVGNHPSQFIVNPTLMERNPSRHVALSYQHPFQSLALQAGALTVQYPLWGKSTIHGVEFFGDDIYSELKVSSGSAWKIQDSFVMGMSLNYQGLKMVGVENYRSITLSFSSLAQISDQLRIGTILEHVIQWNKRIKIPQKFHIGTEYKMGLANLLFALEKESALPLEACLGLLISPQSFWQIGFGYRDSSGMTSLGWRFHTDRLAVYYVYVLHPQLPASTGFGMELILP